MPRQERSWDTYEQVLSAAERLLRDRSFDALRIDDVLSEAGVSTGSFYARFEDKEALLLALIDRYRQELAALGEARAEEELTELHACARREVRHRMRRFRRRAGLIRTVVLEHRRLPASSELVRLTKLVNARIVDGFRPCFREIAHPDPERAVLYGTYFVGAICRDRVLFGRSPHAASVALPLARLEDELTRMLTGYLRAGAPGAPDV